MLDTVLAIQPRLASASGGSGAKSSETLALEVSCFGALSTCIGGVNTTFMHQREQVLPVSFPHVSVHVLNTSTHMLTV